MKIYKFLFAVILTISLIFCQTVSYANLANPNLHIYGGVSGSLWYTKLINLQGYKSKDIKGTLHFELVPDTETKPFNYRVSSGFTNSHDPEDPHNFINVSVLPGEIPYKYDVPFSSDDFVDPEFNRLGRKAKLELRYGYTDDHKAIEEFFDYAFLHEWGTIRSIDHAHVARVRKVMPSQFYWDGYDSPEEKYKEFIEMMDEGNDGKSYWVHWPNDPETKVAGWKCFQDSAGSTDPTKYFGSYEEGCQFLADYESFLDGTFKYSEKFNLHFNFGTKYSLVNITRPIAISKSYDASGNIISIEKPLFPSLEQFIFTEKILDNEGNNYGDINVYRYVLKEKPATGVALKISNEEIIVDVVVNHPYCTVYMYKDRETANKQKYDFYSSNDTYFLGGSPLPNEFTSAIQLENKYITNEYPSTGDTMNIVLYLSLLAVSVVTTIYFIKKKIKN